MKEKFPMCMSCGDKDIIVGDENDLVIVTRWLGGNVLGEFVESMYKAMVSLEK